jgi:hypothetical protein
MREVPPPPHRSRKNPLASRDARVVGGRRWPYCHIREGRGFTCGRAVLPPPPSSTLRLLLARLLLLLLLRLLGGGLLGLAVGGGRKEGSRWGSLLHRLALGLGLLGGPLVAASTTKGRTDGRSNWPFPEKARYPFRERLVEQVPRPQEGVGLQHVLLLGKARSSRKTSHGGEGDSSLQT